eukprot:Gb_16252 [translate_table: standard]
MEREEEQVMSEIHLGCSPDATSHLTRFSISPSLFTGDLKFNIENDGYKRKEVSTCQRFIIDKEGDLVLARRNHKEQNDADTVMHNSVLIHHHVKTTIPCVGFQIWKASLLLADFILHLIQTSSIFNDVIALELGAGTGLVGILLARAAKSVFITDRGTEILDNCLHNVELNSHVYRENVKSVRVRELDWQNPWPPKVVQAEEASLKSWDYKYAWTASEMDEVEEASILLAADVVYSNELTDAFFNVLCKLMPPGSKKVLFLSIEKRYNFTLEDLDIVANGYMYFRKFFEDEILQSTGCASDQPILQEAGIGTPYFTGKRLDVERIPQCIRPYDRGNDIEIWEIRPKSHRGPG